MWHVFGGAPGGRRRGRTGRTGGARSTGPCGSAGCGSARRGSGRRRRARGRHRPGPRVRHRRAPTTRLCLELLQELEPGSLLDVGCGSGVLSIAAALLGYAPVLGVDIEEPSVAATRENAAANGVDVEARLVGGGRARCRRRTSVVANISARRRSRRWPAGSSARSSSPPATSSVRASRRSPAIEHVDAAHGRRLGVRRISPSRLAHTIPRDGDVLASTSSAARSRTSMRTRCAKRCSATVTREARAGTRRRGGDQHLLRHERGGREEPQGGRARRTHARARLRHGLRSEPAGDAFAGLPANVRSWSRSASEETAAFVAGDVGAIGCVQADARLDRVRAFVKIQDGCSFSCNFCVIPLVRGASRSRSADAVLGEIRRRVAQGHREVVLTGINLGCFRDRAAGYDLPRLVREAGATPGLERLRLSSIEINHVDDALVAALRETPTVEPPPARPAAVGRRRRAARDAPPLHGRHLPPPPRAARRRVQPDERRDRRLPGRGRGRVRARRCARSSAPGSRRCTSSRTRRGPGTVDRGRRPRAAAGQEGARRAAARALARALRRALAGRRSAGDIVLVDRPGRGYGDDYSPWLVDAPVGELVPRRAARGHRGGDPCRRRVTTASSAGSCARATYVAPGAKGFVAINDINPQAPVHMLVLPGAARRHVPRRRRVRRRRRRSACSSSSPRPPQKAGLTDYRVLVNVGAGRRGRRSSTCTGTSSGGRPAPRCRAVAMSEL